MVSLIFVNENQTKFSKSLEKIASSQCQKSSKIVKTRRPLNSFMLYRQEKQKKTTLSTMNLHSKELSKVIAIMWKNEKKEVKEKYARLADEEMLLHKQLNPGYIFSPKQKVPSPSICGQKQELKTANFDPFCHKKYHTCEQHIYGLGESSEKDLGDDFYFSEDFFDNIETFPPLTPPSAVVDDSQMFPGGSFDNFEFYTLLSLTQQVF